MMLCEKAPHRSFHPTCPEEASLVVQHPTWGIERSGERQGHCWHDFWSVCLSQTSSKDDALRRDIAVRKTRRIEGVRIIDSKLGIAYWKVREQKENPGVKGPQSEYKYSRTDKGGARATRHTRRM